MKAHKSQIKKIILGTLGLGVFAMLICKAMLEEIANQYIKSEFKLMTSENRTAMSFTINPTTQWTFRDSERSKYGEYGNIFNGTVDDGELF